MTQVSGKTEKPLSLPLHRPLHHSRGLEVEEISRDGSICGLDVKIGVIVVRLMSSFVGPVGIFEPGKERKTDRLLCGAFRWKQPGSERRHILYVTLSH